MRRALQAGTGVLCLMLLLGPVYGQRPLLGRTVVFRVAHGGETTHFTLSCGPSGVKDPSNVWLILTWIDRRFPKPGSVVTITVGGEQMALPINGSGFWSSDTSKVPISAIVNLLEAGSTMTLRYAGGATATFDLAGAWANSAHACVKPDKPQFVAMAFAL